MSIVHTKIEIPVYWKVPPKFPAYIRVTIDPMVTKPSSAASEILDQLPFPSDYKYFSCLLLENYVHCIDRIRNFEVRSDDIWILGFPKSGTTWTQNIVYQLKVTNMDFSAYFHPDTNFFDLLMIYHKIDGNDQLAEYFEYMEKKLSELSALPSPRMIKSHLPAYLLPRGVWTVQPKMIYVSREAKDLAVSMYHMNRNCLKIFDGTASEFFCSFWNDFVDYGPFYEHISSFKQLQHLKHLLFLTYEQLSANTLQCAKDLSAFLDCSYGEEELRQLVDHVSFGKMRDKIKAVAKNNSFSFCRKGKVGGYQNEMSEEEIQLFDAWSTKKKEALNLD